MDELNITVIPNGPLKVEGPCDLLGPDGSPIETREGKAIFLCRCGGSSNKPFCDGTHRRNGFEDPAVDPAADPVPGDGDAGIE